jgi:(2Fe-2S) ferredoxin
MKIKTREDLAALREKYRGDVVMRFVSDSPETRIEINVAIGDCGLNNGARDTLKALFDEVNNAKLTEKVSVIAVGCMNDCSNEPTVEVKIPGKDAVRHTKVDVAKAKEIVSKLEV